MKNFAVLLLMVLSLQSFSQDTLTGINKSFFKSLVIDVRDVVRTPFHADKKQLIMGAGVVTLVSASFLLDDEIKSLSVRNRNDEAEFWFNYMANPIGNLYSYTFIAGWYFKGLMENNNRCKHVALKATEAVLINTLISQAVKRSMNRQRPAFYYDHDADDSFNPFEDDKIYDSFYSGHTSTAFAIATVFAEEYREYKWVPFLSYGLASAAGVARLYLNKHWLSDVTTGAAVGYYIGKVVSNDKKRKYHIGMAPGQKIFFTFNF
jgi:membrane-associated phospholipid phosphatase